MNTSSTGSGLRRRDEIKRLVRDAAIHSQEELQRLLKKRGIDVAQPTLSRDMKDLGLAKTASGYVAPPDEAAPALIPEEKREERLERALREFVLSVETAATLVVLKTPPAAAHPVARALDEASLPDLVGTIAGDDTIFLATSSSASAQRLRERLAAPLRPPAPARRPRA